MIVELVQPHTHAGQDYPPGATLELPEDQARWLIELGAARPAPQPEPRKPTRKGD